MPVLNSPNFIPLRVKCLQSWPQCYEIKNQLQEKKNCKKHKYIQTKYVIRQPMDHWRNQREKQKIHRDIWQWNHNDPEPMGCSKSSSKMKVYIKSNKVLSQWIRNISNKKSNLTSQANRERTTTNNVIRKESINIRAEINEIETKKTIAKSMKLKAGSLRR